MNGYLEGNKVVEIARHSPHQLDWLVFMQSLLFNLRSLAPLLSLTVPRGSAMAASLGVNEYIDPRL
jgi:hypothetical protein